MYMGTIPRVSAHWIMRSAISLRLMGSRIHPQMREEYISGFSVAWHQAAGLGTRLQAIPPELATMIQRENRWPPVPGRGTS